MGHHDIDQVIDDLVTHGLSFPKGDEESDFAVLDIVFGPTEPCQWLEHQGRTVWLRGTEPGTAEFYVRKPLLDVSGKKATERNRYWLNGVTERDRQVGILIGLAAGDRNGGPREIARELFLSLKKYEGLYGTDVKSRYLSWWKADGHDCGPVFHSVMEDVQEGGAWDDSVKAVDARLSGMTAGCNPLHRSPVLAMSWISTAELAQEARREAAFTHLSPIAGDAAASVAVLCRLLMAGAPWRAALNGAWKRTGVAELVNDVGDPQSLDKGGFSRDVLKAAVHFVGSSETFEEALDRALDFAGEANYCPVVVGAVGGARWGASAIPSRHLRHVTDLGAFLKAFGD